MSLYVRVMNNFYTHRKTLRLKAVIGDAAYWVPPRLWAYAAENQPDGCFNDYSAEEIAMLIGYLGDAQALLEALLKACFLDPNKCVHGWAEHNSYHSVFAERAKKGATAMWAKRRLEKKVPDQKGKETSNASSIACVEPPLIFSPNAEPKAEKPKSPTMVRLGMLFGRRESTRWHPDEIKSLGKIEPIPEEELLVIERYYGAKIPEGSDFRRHDLKTLLNNWHGELDRARDFKPSTGY